MAAVALNIETSPKEVDWLDEDEKFRSTWVAVDMSAQKGLRGLLMAWIVLFHCTLKVAVGKTILDFNLQANSLMTFFFILSGFSLAVGYAKTNWAEAGWGDVCAFYRNRFARLMPAYYLTLALSIPLFFMGHSVLGPKPNGGWTWRTILTMLGSNIFCVQQWIQGLPKLLNFARDDTRPLNPPTWFVSVLIFLYLIFPFVISTLQSMSHVGLVRMVCAMYWVNVAACSAIAVFSAWLFKTNDKWATMSLLWKQVRNSSRVFWASTSWPLVRLPVFLMGAAAGLCVVHGYSPLSTADEDEDDDDEARIRRQNRWAFHTDVHMMFFLMCAIVAGMFANIKTGSFPKATGTDIGFNWWGQVLMCYSQAVIIVGLCNDGGRSKLAGFCSLSCLQFLGDIGMEWFLVHEPLVQYLKVITRPKAPWIKDPTIPAWGVPIVFFGSLGAAYVMHHWFSEPLRKRLRAPKRTKPAPVDVKPSQA